MSAKNVCVLIVEDHGTVREGMRLLIEKEPDMEKGYVLKQSSSADLVSAVRVVAAGQCYLDPAVTGKLMGGYAGRRPEAGAEPKEDVTEREEEVLRLIARGHSNKEIAARLSVSVKTVEAHKTNGMRKLGLAASHDIVDYAIFRGWMKND